MTDSLQAAAALAQKLGRSVDEVLPDDAPVIDCDALSVHRIELRQVAGISAGGSLELRPGSYDFGPVSNGAGRLDDGDPDVVGFSLDLDGDMAAVISPGLGPVLVDDQPVVTPTEVGGRVINAGSARFVVARPRPPMKRDGAAPAVTQQLDPWVAAPIPPGPVGGDDAMALVEQRRRLHYGPDEISHRIDGGRPLLFGRGRTHPLFGTAVVAMADVPMLASTPTHDRWLTVPVPVSIDLLGSTTMIAGPRTLQLAVARHIIVALAAATHPRDLSFELRSERPELDVMSGLPHSGERSRARATRFTGHRLIVVDQPERSVPATFDADVRDDRPGRTSMLVLVGEGERPSYAGDVLTVHDEATMTVHGAGMPPIGGATPIGFARSMAADLVGKLAALPVRAPLDG